MYIFWCRYKPFQIIVLQLPRNTQISLHRWFCDPHNLSRPSVIQDDVCFHAGGITEPVDCGLHRNKIEQYRLNRCGLFPSCLAELCVVVLMEAIQMHFIIYTRFCWSEYFSDEKDSRGSSGVFAPAGLAAVAVVALYHISLCHTCSAIPCYPYNSDRYGVARPLKGNQKCKIGGSMFCGNKLCGFLVKKRS